MIKRKLTEADRFLILADFLPVCGVWLKGLNTKEVFPDYAWKQLLSVFLH